METKELITLIENAALKVMELPSGFVYMTPDLLQSIPPAQLIELADHYKVEPDLDNVSHEFKIRIGGPGLMIIATSLAEAQAKPSARELLTSAAA